MGKAYGVAGSFAAQLVNNIRHTNGNRRRAKGVGHEVGPLLLFKVDYAHIDLVENPVLHSTTEREHVVRR